MTLGQPYCIHLARVRIKKSSLIARDDDNLGHEILNAERIRWSSFKYMYVAHIPATKGAVQPGRATGGVILEVES